MAACDWPLDDGHILTFGIYDLNTNWNNTPGLYIFTYQDGQTWHALYIDEADSFAERLANHERYDEALRSGMTHIHAMVVHSESARDEWKRRLVNNLKPKLNSKNTKEN